MDLRVAIDAREISRYQPGGLRRYAESVVEALSEYAHGLDLHAYLDREPPEAVTLPNRFRWQVVGPGQLALREQFTLPNRLRRDGIELAHFLANTAPLRCPVPYVLTLHDTFCIERPLGDVLSKGSLHNRALSLYSKWVPVMAARRARRVITVSEYSARSISRALGIERSRIDVIPNSVHPMFRPTKSAGFRERILGEIGAECIVLVIGSTHPRKNLKTMLAAYNLARQRNPNLGLVIIWTAPFDFGGWSARNGIGPLNNLRIWAHPTDDELVRLYSNSDVFLFMSTLEGFGLPVIEAMACGCPVITSTTSALPETAGSAALLADPEDASGIAEALVRLSEDDLLRESLRAAGQARAAGFCGVCTGESLVDTYLGCIDHKKKENVQT